MLLRQLRKFLPSFCMSPPHWTSLARQRVGFFLRMNHYQQYIKRRTEIEESRLKAFSSIGLASDLLGIKCNRLTARAWIDLRLVKNGILMGSPTQIAVCQYIYRVHFAYPLTGWQKFKVERHVSRRWKRSPINLLGEVYDHLKAAFAEEPESVGAGATQSNKIEGVEGVVSSIDEVAARYGQDPDVIAEKPLAKIFALQKASRLATIPGYNLSEPKDLQDFKTAHMEEKQKEIDNG